MKVGELDLCLKVLEEFEKTSDKCIVAGKFKVSQETVSRILSEKSVINHCKRVSVCIFCGFKVARQKYSFRSIHYRFKIHRKRCSKVKKCFDEQSKKCLKCNEFYAKFKIDSLLLDNHFKTKHPEKLFNPKSQASQDANVIDVQEDTESMEVDFENIPIESVRKGA